MPKYSNIAIEGGRRTSWGAATPLGNLIGVTVCSEKLHDYNRQFSAKFAKGGLLGTQPAIKKGTTVCIMIHKSTKEAKVCVKASAGNE